MASQTTEFNRIESAAYAALRREEYHLVEVVAEVHGEPAQAFFAIYRNSNRASSDQVVELMTEWLKSNSGVQPTTIASTDVRTREAAAVCYEATRGKGTNLNNGLRIAALKNRLTWDLEGECQRINAPVDPLDFFS